MSDSEMSSTKRPSFLAKIGRGRSGNSDSRIEQKRSESFDSDSGSDLEPGTTRSEGLPSFRQTGEVRGSKSDQLIELDAVRTIRNTSGNYEAADENEDSEDMDRRYSEKLARFGGRRASATSSSDSSTDYKNVRFKSHADEYEDDEIKSVKSSDDEGRFDHFKQFFQRGASQRRGMKSLNEENGDEDDAGGLVSRFISNLGQNGGLAPGFPKDSQEKERDVEKTGGQEDIPMVDFNETAQQIVQAHSGLNPNDGHAEAAISDGETAYDSGSQTPSHISFVAPPMEHYIDGDQSNEAIDSDSYDPYIESTAYVAPPTRVRGGVLGSLLKLYQNEDINSNYSSVSLEESVPDTVTATSSVTPPSSKLKLSKAANLKKLKNLPHRKGTAEPSDSSKNDLPSFKNTRPKGKKSRIPKFKKKLATEAKITVHIADLLQRHRFILRMCKALMLYGAPTHRLEEYMIMTSRVLEIDGQFLYLPGCMIVSFGDATTRTSEVQLVRCAQGLNLWKLHQVHMIYKQVVHDTMSAAEGNMLIDRILQEKNLYPPWICVFLYGFCSAMVTPYAFGGNWINMAVSFFMGSCVGALQYIVSQRSNMYSNVFEVTASVVVSFCGRAFGSIPSDICFGAVTQGSLALILPGYIILCGSLELQSRNLVAGSVRMFYAIIYSLFLGFGITLGAALFGWMYKGASNETSCPYPISDWFRFLFVPAFTIGISLINQANWTQLPVMVIISCSGYVVTYWAGRHFQHSTEFTAALAAFVIGLMGNLYSRIWKGLAVSAMLPAIFVQVPSGVASQSSLLSGLQSANQLTNHNGTAAESDLSSSMSFGVTMIQVSIGITVGLFMSSLFIYPFGKKKTGLFSL
ncbi:hypothetical protein HG536_0F01380 [Torulaspora globosa]|uniref:Pheromone-regulated membrane protein 10 n=1 Tax=Torulaspora globosa TaxID=48254 RepID=A0A7G3ZJX7_9SACH|nr:uncharacterized protein HG536_0F01380 [Torulaspora globosa]QLL33813.1 hypothetical protein HG536_0F01380 [Torulaspora globosa]